MVLRLYRYWVVECGEWWVVLRDAVEIISDMKSVAPPGQMCLDDVAFRQLQWLTAELRPARGETPEYDRFLGIVERDLDVPAELTDKVADAEIMVIGGTGCIGSKLISHLLPLCSGLGCLVSVSRGATRRYPKSDAVRYRYADIRDRESMDVLMREYKPDLVFHVAAQRDPGLAELEVYRTVSTNVLGTRNVLHAAADAGVPQVVCASTGKALRPYSPDIYTASKRVAEWVAAGVAVGSDMLVSAARFTHVLDNSIFYNRLCDWAIHGEAVRLHSPDIAFYVQSARESAHLLLLASLAAKRSEFRISAIRDLGWPVGLLDLALGVLSSVNSRSPVYFSGYDRGYEEKPYPGLYDQQTAGDVSPLLNMFEAASLVPAPSSQVDTFRMEVLRDQYACKLLSAMDEAFAVTQARDVTRAMLDELSWSVLDAALRAVSSETLARSVSLAELHEAGMSSVHRRVLGAVRSASEVTSQQVAHSVLRQ